FPVRLAAPYSAHGEKSRFSQKSSESAAIESTPRRGEADLARTCGAVESRDQSWRKRDRFLHRPAAAAGQFLGPPLGRRGRDPPRTQIDAEDVRCRRASSRSAAALFAI